MDLRIKEVIKEKGMTITELADKMGINRVNLSNMVNGNPTVETLNKIATALNVPITELFSAGANEELTALIQHKGDYYKATTIAELENIVDKIKSNI